MELLNNSYPRFISTEPENIARLLIGKRRKLVLINKKFWTFDPSRIDFKYSFKGFDFTELVEALGLDVKALMSEIDKQELKHKFSTKGMLFVDESTLWYDSNYAFFESDFYMKRFWDQVANYYASPGEEKEKEAYKVMALTKRFLKAVNRSPYHSSYVNDMILKTIEDKNTHYFFKYMSIHLTSLWT
jgi:hypothetical protein